MGVRDAHLLGSDSAGTYAAVSAQGGQCPAVSLLPHSGTGPAGPASIGGMATG